MNRAFFESVVSDTLDELPPEIRRQLDNLTIVVEDRPTPDQDPRGDGLLGLYEGISLAERGIDYFGTLPDRISVFMEGHIALGLGRDDLAAEIRTTVLHEIGHHLGFDERRLHELGWG